MRSGAGSILWGSIEPAADGVEGVARAESWRPDVVLLDLAMPRMGGLRALEAIRAWSLMPIIVLSVMGEKRPTKPAPSTLVPTTT